MIYIALALFVCAFYFTCVLPAQWVEVRRVRKPLGLGVRILQVSDLHVEKTWVGPERLRRLIVRESPDYVFLTGDYTQRLRHLPKVDAYLRAIRAAGVPVYAVLGNHDYRLKSDLPKLIALFERRGIPLLRNESIRVGGFRLVGIDDDYTGKSLPRKAFKDAFPGETCIVATHDPTVTLRMHRPYDYMMSGHFHGGQFRVPFVFRLRGKGPLPLRGIIKGTHEDGNGTYYISKGLGQTGFNFRFLVRSEITVHEL